MAANDAKASVPKKGFKPWQWCLIAVCMFLMFFGRVLPPIWGLGADAMLAIGIFIGTLLLLIFVDTNWPPLLLMIAIVVGGLMPVQGVLTASMGNSVTQYVLFATMLAYSLRKSGFLERIAVWVSSRKLSKTHPWLYITLLMAAPMFVGMFIDVMTNLIVFYTVYSQVLEHVGYKKGEKTPRLFVMTLLFMDALSAASTPISHPAVILGMGMYETSTGSSVGFMQYCVWGALFSVVVLAVTMLLLRFVFRMDISRFQSLEASELQKNDAPISTSEKVNVAVFLGVVLLWVAPGLLQNVALGLYKAVNSWGTVTPALIGIIALCLIHVDGEPLMNINEAATKGVAWGAVWLTASTMLLLSLIGNADLGIIDAATVALSSSISGIAGIGFVLFGMLLVVIMSNFCSNNVSLALAYTLTVPLILAGTVSGVNPLVLTCMLSFGSQVAIATPAGSAYAGMANGFGWFDTAYQFRTGFLY